MNEPHGYQTSNLRHTSSLPRPLDGITVVTVEQALAAPMATCRLADAGARVIKVERPDGDFARGYDVAANGISSYFAWGNRGKESVVLDLKSDVGKAELDSLIGDADVFVQNLAVGATQRLGFASTTLRERDPHLITCDISGYGSDGPFAEAKAYDLLIQAESGLLSISGAPGPLGRVGVSVVDISTALNATIAITTAIVRQQQTGQGASLEISMFDSIADWMTVPLLHHDYLDAAPTRGGIEHPSIAPYGAFTCSDNVDIVICVQSEREWAQLCSDVLGDSQLAHDPELCNNVMRVTNRGRVDALLQAVCDQHDAESMIKVLTTASIACGRVNDVAALSAHPHLRRVTVRHELGTVDYPGSPVQADWHIDGDVPRLGEHQRQ